MSKVIKGIQVPQRADFVGSFLRPQNLSDSTASSTAPSGTSTSSGALAA